MKLRHNGGFNFERSLTVAAIELLVPRASVFASHILLFHESFVACYMSVCSARIVMHAS